MACSWGQAAGLGWHASWCVRIQIKGTRASLQAISVSAAGRSSERRQGVFARLGWAGTDVSRFEQAGLVSRRASQERLDSCCVVDSVLPHSTSPREHRGRYTSYADDCGEHTSCLSFGQIEDEDPAGSLEPRSPPRVQAVAHGRTLTASKVMPTPVRLGVITSRAANPGSRARVRAISRTSTAACPPRISASGVGSSPRISTRRVTEPCRTAGAHTRVRVCGLARQRTSRQGPRQAAQRGSAQGRRAGQ